MKLFRFTLWLLFLGFTVTAAEPAAGPGTTLIRLKDKSQILGQIQGYQNGVYTVKSESLGIVRVPEARIASMVYDKTEQAAEQTPTAAGKPVAAPLGAGAATADPADPFPGFNALLKSITANPALMSRIETLRQDPAVQSVINDPEVNKAIESGNIMALFGNEKVQSLLRNPNVTAVTRDITDGKQTKPAPADRRPK